jgi:predicted nuclease of predicted toxin-antitoxin system
MRVLVNENISRTVIEEMRRRGHDVLSAKESMLADPDEALLERARRESRVLLTQDKDFGELAFRAKLPAECGVVLFRLGGCGPESDSNRILGSIEARQDWAGHFAVVTDDRIRIRPLPDPRNT